MVGRLKKLDEETEHDRLIYQLECVREEVEVIVHSSQELKKRIVGLINELEGETK